MVGYWIRNRQNCIITVFDPLPGDGPHPGEVWYWAITHRWANDMQKWMTPINNCDWPVPCHLTSTFEEIKEIRRQALQAGALYSWLDVLFIWQKMDCRSSTTALNEEQQLREWSIDIPTIGNIYRQATNVIRYFNSLRRTLQITGWDSDRHWTNRDWTLQETRPEISWSTQVFLNGCCSLYRLWLRSREGASVRCGRS